VKLAFAFQTKSKVYMIMHFVNGGELFFHLRREKKFDELRAKFYIAEIVLALDHLHKLGIIYRDLKPENVLIGVEGHIKLTDFGLSKLGANENLAYSFVGTPEYLAPEIIKGFGHSQKVDVWSLGLVLYEMLSGYQPFKLKNKNKFEIFQLIMDPDKSVQMLHSFSPQAKSLVAGLLEKDVSPFSLILQPEKRLSIEDIK
jgi:serine/threonine protein kinase